MDFIAETARLLTEKERHREFIYIADGSAQLLQGNLSLKKIMLLMIIEKCGLKAGWSNMSKYYLEVVELLGNSTAEIMLRIKILQTIGKAYLDTSHYSKTLSYLTKAKHIAEKLNIKSESALCDEILGDAYSCQGDYKKAIECYKGSLSIRTKLGNRSGIASSNGSLGSAYCSLGQYEKAIEYHEKALRVSIEIGNQSEIARNQVNLGSDYLNLGQYEKAIQNYEKSLTISNQIGDRSGSASIQANLGGAYDTLGQHKKASEFYNRSLKIKEEMGDRLSVAIINSNLGTIYWKMGQHEKAIKSHEKGLALSTELGDRVGIAKSNGHLGDILFNLGQYERAIEYLKQGIKISTKIGDRPEIAIGYGNLGKAYGQLQQYEKAIEASKTGLKISAEIGDTWAKCRCATNIGFSYLLWSESITCKAKALENVNHAISYLKMSVRSGDEIFSELTADENMSSFSNEYFAGYVYLMHCFIFLNRIEAALLVWDLGKAKALQACVEQQKNSKTVEMTNYTHETWQRIDSNEEKIQTCDIVESFQLKKDHSTVLYYAFDRDMFLNIWVLNGVDKISHISPRESGNSNSHEIFLFSCLKKLLEPFSVNLTRDSSFCGIYSDTNRDKHRKKQLSGFLENTCSKIKNSNQKDVIQRYDLHADQQNGLGVPKSKTSHLKEGVDCHDLEVEITKVRSTVDQNDENRLQTDSLLQVLFKNLINPVKNLINGAKIIIVPDEFLFFAPFSALKDETGSILSKHYSVQITPSLHTLYSHMKKSRHDSLGFALFVGNPKVGRVSFGGKAIKLPDLPCATTEVQCLAPLFDAKSMVENAAVKKRVIDLIRDAGLIHIAAHGEPKRGEVFLAPNPSLTNNDSSLPKEESYLLRQEDVMAIDINAALVVLCCCHTGRGEVVSEGVIGLTRAFLAAGARSVLATLWPIDDEGTKIFMQNFYAEICKETSVCEALRRTMNKFQQHENNDCRDIKIWAPFTIYGEDVRFSKQDIDEIKKKSREISF